MFTAETHLPAGRQGETLREWGEAILDGFAEFRLEGSHPTGGKS
jgi:hypothetical protein